MALLGAGAVACASYAVQRLIDAGNEPPMGTVLRQATIPYYWRVAFSLVHAAGVGALLWVAVSPPRAEVWLARLPWILAATVLPAALAMALVP